jgi:TBC1 domain family member 20
LVADESAKVIDARKKVLFDLIARVLRSHPMLCYFQGFHDIVQVIMLVLGAEAAYPAIEAISLFRIRDYMLPSLTPAIKHIQLLPCILRAADMELAAHLTLPHVHYALPAALTLYAHDIENYRDIVRLFDFILAHPPIMSIYLFAAITISRRKELLDIPADDHDILFFTLQKLPQPLDLESLATKALQTFEAHPPDRLPGWTWRSISSYSVLKTAQAGRYHRIDSINEAETCFRRQAAEMRREEARQKAMQTAFKYRGTLATTAAAIAVGALSVWMRRSGHDRYILSLMSSMWKVVKR